jgi:hypothetical protein
VGTALPLVRTLERQDMRAGIVKVDVMATIVQNTSHYKSTSI